MLFNVALAVLAIAAPALAGPASSAAPAMYGCMTDADCGSGYSCGAHNICVKNSAIMVGCSTDADCKGRYPYPAVCMNAICVAAVPKPTVTIIECAACEGGYTTSTCYPDVTTTITACNTCVTPVTPVTPPASTKKLAPVTTPACSTCTPVVTPTMPIFVSGAQRTQMAYAGLVGVVAIVAFML